jgi:hypothetical protein
MRADQFYQIINVNTEHCVRSSDDDFPAEYVLNRENNLHLSGEWQVCLQSFDICMLHIDLVYDSYITISQEMQDGRRSNFTFSYKNVCGSSPKDIVYCLRDCQDRIEADTDELHAFFPDGFYTIVPIMWVYDESTQKCSVKLIVNPNAHPNNVSIHMTMSSELAEMLGFSDEQRTIEARGLRGQPARIDGRSNDAPTIADDYVYIHKNIENLYVLLPGLITSSTLVNNVQLPCIIRIPGLKAPEQTQRLSNSMHHNKHRTHYCPDEKALYFDCMPNMIWQYRIQILLNNGKLARFCKDPGFVTLSLIFKRKTLF